MTKWTVLQIAAVLSALAAALVCQSLLDRHITGKPGPSWFEAGCSDDAEAGSTANCAAVLASPWSYWPPLAEGDPPDKPRIPVAFLGLVYYGILAVWFLGVGRPSQARRWVVLLPALIMIPGLGGSIFFIYIMFTKLDAWCPWCMVTHVLNVFLAICLVLLIPRKPKANAPDAETAPTSVHPTWRLGVMTLVGMGLVMFGVNKQYGRAVAEKSFQHVNNNLSRCLTEIRKVQKDGKLLLAKFLGGEVQQVDSHPDAPYRLLGSSKAEPLHLEMYSDFECPSCRKIAEFIEKDVQRLFDGAVAVVFRHYPLDQKCNPHSARTMHPNACAAARLTEAARQLGGNEGFWKAHDYIFAHQHDLKRGRFDMAALSKAIGVASESLVANSKSARTTQRIKEDIADARALGVTGTPAIFANGRRVGVLYMREMSFWDTLADRFWQQRGEQRPPHTKRQGQ